MPSTSSIRLAGSLAALLLSGAAIAADLPARSIAPLPSMAQQPLGGFYFASRTGLTFADDTNFGLARNTVRVETEYDIGATSFFGLGYNFGPVLGGITPRVEVEGFFGDLSVDTHRVNGTEFASIDSFGEIQTFGGFASAYLDFNLGTLMGGGGVFAAVTPFIGGGVGAANVELKKQGVSPTGTVIDDEDTRFAYHLSAGVGVSLGQLGFGGALFDRSTLEVGYRYLSVPDLEFTARDGTRSKTDYNSNMVTVGFRRQF